MLWVHVNHWTVPFVAIYGMAFTNARHGGLLLVAAATNAGGTLKVVAIDVDATDGAHQDVFCGDVPHPPPESGNDKSLLVATEDDLVVAFYSGAIYFLRIQWCSATRVVSVKSQRRVCVPILKPTCLHVVNQTVYVVHEDDMVIVREAEDGTGSTTMMDDMRGVLVTPFRRGFALVTMFNFGLWTVGFFPLDVEEPQEKIEILWKTRSYKLSFESIASVGDSILLLGDSDREKIHIMVTADKLKLESSTGAPHM
jgi:hypothetical protein